MVLNATVVLEFIIRKIFKAVIKTQIYTTNTQVQKFAHPDPLTPLKPLLVLILYVATEPQFVNSTNRNMHLLKN